MSTMESGAMAKNMALVVTSLRTRTITKANSSKEIDSAKENIFGLTVATTTENGVKTK
jgi:hypothetical protein